MYPIRIFGIRVPPDGPFEYALYDDTAREDGRDPVTCFPSIEDAATFVAHMLFSSDEGSDTALLCIRQPEHIHNLFAFSARPIVREWRGISYPPTRRLTTDERVAFLEQLYLELNAIEVEKK